jgi:hypothetical protein
MLCSVKTGTQAYRCRKTLHSCRIPSDNMWDPFADFSLTRLRFTETIRRCGPNVKSGSCKKYRSFAAHLFKHTHILYNSISWIAAYFYSKLRRKFVYFYRHVKFKCCWCLLLSIVRPYSVKEATSLLTVDVKDKTFADGSRYRRLSIHCWQSISKTYLSMSVVGVEDSAFIVGSRCRRPTFRCQQSVSSLMLKL